MGEKMNPFLNPNADLLRDPPRRAYARFEKVEPIDPEDYEERFLVYTAFSADWLDEQGSELYNLKNPSVAETYWQEYWRRLFLASRGQGEFPEDLFRPIPIFQYEFWSNPKGDQRAESYLELMSEGQWLVIEQTDDKMSLMANVYSNLFGEGQRVRISTRPLEDGDKERALNAMVDPSSWPDATPTEIEDALKEAAQKAEYLAAYDVGQASANGLLNEKHRPFMYYDLGAPPTNNTRTEPSSPIRFCWTENPIVILSHWDTDHWAGGARDTRSLHRTWIVPRQTMEKSHIAFANDILHANGKILMWPGTDYTADIALGTGQKIMVAQCTGTKNDRNKCGLAIRVDDTNHGEKKHWLATGDAGYNFVPFKEEGEVVGLIVPHHGGKMTSNRRTLPKRGNSKYARLIYSYGPANDYNHPRPESVDEHIKKGWKIPAWTGKPDPGHTNPGGETRATAEHHTKHCGAVIIGWDSPPTFHGVKCGWRECSMPINQS